MNTFLHRSATACAMLLAAGCTTMIPGASPEDNTLPLERSYKDVIYLSGRLSLCYEQAVHGSFSWNQSTRHIVLSLLSPLGQTLATIDIKPDIAILTQSGKAPLMAADVDVLTAQALGWPLPVSGLRDWLQGFGRSADGKPFVAQPSSDATRFSTHDGWSLSYGEWQNGAARTVQNHPKRIDLTRDTKQAGPVAIRIVIDNWQTQ